MIIACEGVDGAGKNTLVSLIREELLTWDIPVATLAFPRYEHSVHAKLAQQALYGSMGDLIDSIQGMATLFALDRADIAEEITDLSEEGYVLLLDRYISSNAAYSTARSQEDQRSWVEELEVHRLNIPRPDMQILVDVDTNQARERAELRESQDSARKRDAYERDFSLQERTGEVYRQLAQEEYLSPWIIVNNSANDENNVAVIARQIADRIATEMKQDGDEKGDHS